MSQSHAQTAAISTVIDALEIRSVKQPDEAVYVILRDGEIPDRSFTYRELRAEAWSCAAALAAAGLAEGSAVVLLYPTGLEFIKALFGCMYANVAAAPVQVPTRRRGIERLRRIADDSGTRTILTTAAIKRELETAFAEMPEMSGLTFLATDALPVASGELGHRRPRPGDTALLQYTSGSTGQPKGVMISHANFVHNVAEIEETWPFGEDSIIVSWLPLFHDMGMLMGVVLPICCGVTVYLMEPTAFIRRPLRWLEAISRFRGTHAAAPSFAYDQCVRAGAQSEAARQLDLSSWRAAINGAEPVRWTTVEAFTSTFALAGFAPEAMSPAYGLAENTVKVTGSPPHRRPSVLWVSSQALVEGRVEIVDTPQPGVQPLVGSGYAATTTRVRVVDPVSLRPCSPGTVGEIWISGPCVALGYHGRVAETQETFGARPVGETDTQPSYLRTGDLGFLHEGELFIAGRLKDVIIRNGRNYYPQDVEVSAERADAGLHPNCAAAFSVDDGETERLVIVVEADRRVLRDTGENVLQERILLAVNDGQRLWADEVVIVQRGRLPRTTSGKVQRRACRELYLGDALKVIR